MNPTLLPFAATCTALYLGLGILPFTPGELNWADALALLPESLNADGMPLLPLYLAIPLGFAWQGVVWPRAVSSRLASSLGVFMALGLLALLLRWGQLAFPPSLAVPGGWFAPALGYAVGMALWWSFGAPMFKRLPPLSASVWPWLVLAAAASVLLPLDLGAPLSEPALPRGISSFFSDIPQRIYSLIKSAILWVPVGVLYTLSGRCGALPLWGTSLSAALLLEGLPLLSEQPLSEMLELFFALPGLWAGAWLGERSTAAIDSLASAPMKPGHSPRTLPAALPGDTVDFSPINAEAASSDVAPSSSHRQSHRQAVENGRLHPVRLISGLLFLAFAGVAIYSFPLWQGALLLGALAYMATLWLWPLAWLVVVPAALPLLDLAPWSGRFFFDEFDLLMLVTAATLFLRGRRWPGLRPTPVWPLLALCGASTLISMLLGLGSLPAFDANAFSNYWSNYNSLRVAKGFLWGALIFVWLRLTRPESTKLANLLALGMGVGLLGVGLVGLWERWLFAGFADDTQTYRIVSTFSSMHTGGGHIEAYLVAALPFLWLGMIRLWGFLLALPVMALTVYVTIFTVARGGALALGVVLLILAVASLRLAWRSGQRRQAALPIGVLSLLAVGLLTGISGGYFQQRLAQSAEDWHIRLSHWNQSLSMMDATPMTQMFGMGLGSFPRVYLERGPADRQPATFGFVVEKDNLFLRLGSGDTLYYAQRVAVRAGEKYRLEMSARSRQEGARIETPVCEKQLLNSRHCTWIGFALPGDGQWHRLSHDFSSGEVGVEDGLQRPPVELFLYQPGKTGLVDVDNVRLLDANGTNLLGNGTFTQGGDYWFFKTHSHLPWHIKNVWVHTLFEQGWIGLLLLTGLAGFTLLRLSRAAWRGQRLAWACLASLLGLLTVGMFDSLLDTPRLTTLLAAFILLGVGYEWDSATRPSRRRRKSRRNHAAQPPNHLGTTEPPSS